MAAVGGGHHGTAEGVVQLLEGCASVPCGEGGSSGLGADAVPGGPVQGGRALVDGREVPGDESFPKGAEVVLLLVGEDAVAQGVADALDPTVGDGLGDVIFGGPGPAGYGLEGVPEGGLIEGGGAGSLGGQLDHLPEALGVEVTALGVLPAQEAR